MKYLYLTISSIIVAYLVVIIFVYFYQRNLLYHPTENNYQDDKVQFNYDEIFIKVDEEIKLKSWLIKKDFVKYKTLVVFHGNAGHLSNRIYKLNELYKLDINILLISWRGFSGNNGSPTEQNLYRDAEAAIKWLKDQKVRNNQIILYGESLGSGVAVEIGKRNKYNSIILESPFTSIENSAKIYYPYLPVRLLLKDRYDSISKIKMIDYPVLIMHGKKDDVVPFSMGKELYEKANSPKHSYFTSDDDHMMEFNSKLLNEIRNFIQKY
tara:strand:+ start:1033 stop:1833 length:801 start_codon:yes stop_codon:yes gene_type:complete